MKVTPEGMKVKCLVLPLQLFQLKHETGDTVEYDETQLT